MLVHDPKLAAYLQYKSYRFTLENPPVGPITFDFDAPQEAAEEYFANVPVGVFAYASALEQIKALISASLTQRHRARERERGAR